MSLTNAEIDAAIPVAGEPSRALTNAALKQLVVDVEQSPTRYARPLQIGFAGDSIALQWAARNGTSPLWWAATELYPCEYEVTLSSGVGGSSASNLISVQIAELEAMTTVPDIVIVQSLQNDYIGTAANAATFLAYVTEYAERALAAGVKLVVLCSHPPKSSVPDVASALYLLNRSLEQFCRVTPGTFYCDVFGAWRRTNAADSSGVAWRGTAFGADAFSDDGTHPTALACRNAAPLIAPVLQRFARPLEPMLQLGVAYDDADFPYNNVFGGNGMMLGTGGEYNGVNDANVPGVSTGAYDRWSVTDGDGITATPSIVTGVDGYRYLQLTLSGTASAAATVQVRHSYFQDVAIGDFVTEAMIRTQSLTGVRSLGWFAQSLASGSFDATTTQQFSIGTGRFLFRSAIIDGFSNSGFATRTNDFRIEVASGATVSGSVQLGRCGIFRLS